jgi:hypothetical protein
LLLRKDLAKSLDVLSPEQHMERCHSVDEEAMAMSSKVRWSVLPFGKEAVATLVLFDGEKVIESLTMGPDLFTDRRHVHLVDLRQQAVALQPDPQPNAHFQAATYVLHSDRLHHGWRGTLIVNRDVRRESVSRRE